MKKYKPIYNSLTQSIFIYLYVQSLQINFTIHNSKVIDKNRTKSCTILVPRWKMRQMLSRVRLISSEHTDTHIRV